MGLSVQRAIAHAKTTGGLAHTGRANLNIFHS